MNSSNFIHIPFSFQTLHSSTNLTFTTQNMHQFNQKQKYLRKLQMQLSGKNTGHWNQHQKINYYLFLQKHKNHFYNKQLRRTDKIFKEMANFLETRAADQCRSHHQKMEKKYKSFDVILQTLKSQYLNKLEQDNLKNWQEITNGSPRSTDSNHRQTAYQAQNFQPIFTKNYFMDEDLQKYRFEDVRELNKSKYQESSENSLLNDSHKNQDFIIYDIDKFLS